MYVNIVHDNNPIVEPGSRSTSLNFELTQTGLVFCSLMTVSIRALSTKDNLRPNSVSVTSMNQPIRIQHHMKQNTLAEVKNKTQLAVKFSLRCFFFFSRET